jgi:hypothetical protein
MTDQLTTDALGDDYRSWLAELKQRVERARQRAAMSANRELVTLYWQIGRDILERQQRQGWGARVVDQLARDLKAAFPDMRGFSPRKPQVHARARPSMARAGICATTCCTIAVVTRGDAAGQA